MDSVQNQDKAALYDESDYFFLNLLNLPLQAQTPQENEQNFIFDFFQESQSCHKFPSKWESIEVSLENFEDCFGVGGWDEKKNPSFEEKVEKQEQVDSIEKMFESIEISTKPKEKRCKRIRTKDERGLKFIVKKLIQLYDKEKVFPDHEEALQKIYRSITTSQKKTKSIKGDKKYLNLKRRIYDCRNTIKSLSQSINEDMVFGKEKSTSAFADKEAEIYDLKTRYSYLRKVISNLKKNEKKNKRNSKKGASGIKEEF